jgi:hypothetical protein
MREEVVDGGAGAAVDEVHRAVVGAAVAARVEDAVGIGGEAAIGEEHRLDPLPELLVRQEEKAFAARAALGHLSPLWLRAVYVSLVDIPRINCRSDRRISRNIVSGARPIARNIRKMTC